MSRVLADLRRRQRYLQGRRGKPRVGRYLLEARFHEREPWFLFNLTDRESLDQPVRFASVKSAKRLKSRLVADLGWKEENLRIVLLEVVDE